ncbi:MAG: DNA polymerase III subunit delta' [Candidatus Omnitrophota bacterium]
MSVPANDSVVSRLAGMHAAGRLGHAYLFMGPRGIGKHETALALASRINCLKAGLGGTACDCASCRKITAGNHPDIFVVEKAPDKAFITIDQMRWITERLGFRALEGRVKCAIVRDADLVNEAAANALLKTLEEPSADTVLILTSALPQALPATLRSRCQAVRFPALANDVLAQCLKSRYDMPSDDAAALAAFGQGSPGRAAALGDGFMERRRALFDAFFGRGGTDDFIKAAGADRDSAREALGVVLMAWRDALLIKAGDTEHVVNRDRQVEVQRLAGRFTFQELDGHVSRTIDAIRRIDGNQNIKIVLTVVREMVLI